MNNEEIKNEVLSQTAGELIADLGDALSLAHIKNDIVAVNKYATMINNLNEIVEMFTQIDREILDEKGDKACQ